MGERMADVILPETHGLRAWYMNEARRIEHEYGYSTSNFTLVSEGDVSSLLDGEQFSPEAATEMISASAIELRAPHPELISTFSRILRPHLPDLERHAESLGGDRVIVRSSPVDELNRRDLSFAGAYRGYMPIKPGTRESDLTEGTATMLAGSFTRYSNAYYKRHQIKGQRKVGAILMEPFMNLASDVPLFYGTAYIHNDHIRNEYQVSPTPGFPHRDPQLHVVKGGESWTRDQVTELEDETDFHPRIVTALSGLQKHFKRSLDVEYLVDPNGDLYVVQVRAISAPHLANWNKLDRVEMFPGGSSAIINTVGVTEGTIYDLRNDRTSAVSELREESILLLRHEGDDGFNSESLFTSLADAEPKHDLRVIIDHSGSRRRDHLQYALGEDLSVSFITHIGDGFDTAELRNGSKVKITSTGLNPLIEIVN